MATNLQITIPRTDCKKNFIIVHSGFLSKTIVEHIAMTDDEIAEEILDYADCNAVQGLAIGDSYHMAGGDTCTIIRV